MFFKNYFFRKNSKSYEEAMKDARTRKASNYFDKENQGILLPTRDSDELTIRNSHPALLNF